MLSCWLLLTFILFSNLLRLLVLHHSSRYKSRFLAASIHFCISLVIFSALFFIIITIWYPQPYFSASGGWQGLKIIALVDLVLGPLITLIIYNDNKSKRELLFDLSIVVFFQISALCYGIHAIYTQRPLAIVFWESKFYTVPAQAFDQQRMDTSILQTLSSEQPAIIYAKKPIRVIGLKAMLKVNIEQKIPPMQQVNLYHSIKLYKQDILSNGIDINEVITFNADMASQLLELLNSTDTKQADNIYLALESKYQNIILVFNAEAEQIGFLKAPFKDQL